MKVGVVLSGGGSRGIAHFGALQAITDFGLKIELLSGTSAGALASVLFASGISPKECLKILENLKVTSILKPAFNRYGLLNIESSRKFFEQILPLKNIEDLSIKTTITATDLDSGAVVYFENGEILPRMWASCCIPGVFRPIEIDGKQFVDGGVMNNFPVEPIYKKTDCLIGINVTPKGNNLPTKSVKDIMMKAFYLAVNQNIDYKKDKCRVFVEPQQLSGMSGLSISKPAELFDLGYAETLEKLKKADLA